MYLLPSLYLIMANSRLCRDSGSVVLVGLSEGRREGIKRDGVGIKRDGEFSNTRVGDGEIPNS